MEKKEEPKVEISDDDIQALKVKPEDKRRKENRTPREKTQAQKEAWIKALAKRKENNDLRLKIKAEEERKIAKLIEDKIVKKAVSIKKKQIKKQTVLDDISDDETPLEEINKIVQKLPPTRRPNKKVIMPKSNDDIKPTPPKAPQYVFL